MEPKIVHTTLPSVKEEKILTFQSMNYFNNDWNLLMDVLNSMGNPKWRISGSLNLVNNKDVTDLNNLISVGGSLNLNGTRLSKKYTEEQIRQMVNVEVKYITKN